ncbi:D-glycero-beta-D-manno-heptose 1,7-bisphosphate 7-phosphatase [Facilibium subflavum]|uniref:D-glycero-beta-D-manno-heptose 1,7-bisphosphate 7-phosphatase n=1 Tax=Facilibium subflavum TaxID=2219058 RepID=UPI000E64EABA|nr:D-glycero-beta-D-manno-heptose 1,7-bisphosphate 7-phosphatase [Facilibium subflavum]
MKNNNNKAGKLPTLVILDRDGVINEDSDQYIKSSAEWLPIQGSLRGIKKLKQLKIPVAIATNQSGIARGFFSYAALHDMHQKLFSLLKTDADAIRYIAVCPHGPCDDCDCRKPKTGMLLEISQKLLIELSKSVYFVGDSLKDIQAANQAGCTPVLVKTGKGEKTYQQNPVICQKLLVFDNLQQFVESLL